MLTLHLQRMKITNVHFDVMYNPKKRVISIQCLSSLFLPFLSPSFYVTSLCVPCFCTYNKLWKFEGCLRICVCLDFALITSFGKLRVVLEKSQSMCTKLHCVLAMHVSLQIFYTLIICQNIVIVYDTTFTESH